MAYKTAFGKDIEYPYALAAKAVRTGSEDVIAVVNATHNIFTALQIADAEVITLREENKRLRYENEFIIRLINNKEHND